MSRSRRRGEEGFAGGFAGLAFGALIFVVGTLLAGAAWSVIDAKAATVEAAREAARAYVSSTTSAGATSAADQAAVTALRGYGRSPSKATVTVSSGSFGRCQRVTIVVSYKAPAVLLPFVGGLVGGETVTARHSEVVEPYRSGPVGVANCG